MFTINSSQPMNLLIKLLVKTSLSFLDIIVPRGSISNLGSTTLRGHFFLKKKGKFLKNERGTSLFIAKSWGQMPPSALRFLRLWTANLFLSGYSSPLAGQRFSLVVTGGGCFISTANGENSN